MKTKDRGTRMQTIWQVGDLVRLKEDERMGLEYLRGKAGEFGRVTRVDDNFYIEITLNGYSRTTDGMGGGVRMYNSGLEPWTREPRDEPAIAANVMAAVKYVAWTLDASCMFAPSGLATLSGKAIVPAYGENRHHTNPTVLADAMAYLGDGKGSLADPKGIDWRVNDAGHALLDGANVARERTLAGGGQGFEMFWGRDGTFRAKDKGTGLNHAFSGKEGRRLLEANRKEVGWVTDGKMASVLRAALEYPRTLRIDATSDPALGVVVIETGEDSLEVRRAGETHTVEGDEAKAIRKACAKVERLALWIRARPELLEAPEGPSPGMP